MDHHIHPPGPNYIFFKISCFYGRRNKDVVNKVLSREFMDSVLTLAGFPEEEAESSSSRADTSVDWGLILEACKVTSNVYHQVAKVYVIKVT